jgi:hypothetical protein
MCFLRVKHWDGGGWGKLVRWEVNSGAHGVTRPTAHGLVAMRWVRFQSVKSDISGVFTEL